MSAETLSSPVVAANPSAEPAAVNDERISWLGSLPFFAVHVMCFAAFFCAFHWRDVIACFALYVLGMWGITAGYHRYFAHRSYKTSRWFQFVIALNGTLTLQKGVLWWAGHHRHHHRESDQEGDIHSPMLKGFWFSHMGWILCPKYNATPHEKIKDFSAYPELRWLNKHYLIPPVALAVLLYFVGGFSLLVWAFFIRTTLLWHGTFTINSLSHIFGSRRYKTTDTSRNNWLLALITLGEGWHNNHHYYQNTANQGWFWWEVDLSYYSLVVLSKLGLIWELRTPTERVKNAYLAYTDEDRALLRTSTPFGGATAPLTAKPKPNAASEALHAVLDAAKELPLAAPAPQPMLKRQ